MLIVISPAKKQRFDTAVVAEVEVTTPQFSSQAETLVALLKNKTVPDLQKLMALSPTLAKLNVERFQSFDTAVACPALFAFQGDVYQGLAAASLPKTALIYAENHLAILSGLYGLLSPFDLIKPHRLEMGSALATQQGKNLYHFWGESITQALNHRLATHQNPVLINLASQEYFRAIRTNILKHPVIDIEFREYKNGQYKVVSLFAKRARGKMARYILENELATPDAMKSFTVAGYRFSAEHSTECRYVFVR